MHTNIDNGAVAGYLVQEWYNSSTVYTAHTLCNAPPGNHSPGDANSRVLHRRKLSPGVNLYYLPPWGAAPLFASVATSLGHRGEGLLFFFVFCTTKKTYDRKDIYV